MSRDRPHLVSLPGGAPKRVEPKPQPDDDTEETGRATPTMTFRLPPWRREAPGWHRVVEIVMSATALIAIVAIVLILLFVLSEGLPLLWSSRVHQEVTLQKIWTPQAWEGGVPRWVWQPTSATPKYGIAPLLIGSLKITAVAIAIGAPLGILAAIFVSQIAPRKLRAVLKPTIELLAGIPSVVLGVFALLVLATWLQRLFGFQHRLNAIVAGVALSLTLVPLIFTIAEDALSAVPVSYRNASLALGASRMYTIRHVVLPAALPGIAAAVVLGFGRAIGETMIVLMASGNAPLTGWSFGQSTRTITATIAQEMADVVHGSPHYVVLFALGATLLLFTFITNLIAHRMVEGFRRRRGAS